MGRQTIVNQGTITGVLPLVSSSTVIRTKNAIRAAHFRLPGSGAITNSGTISGVTASVHLTGPGANTLTLQTGSTLVGDAIGSTTAGSTTALILQGQGIATNNFKNFNTLEAQDGHGGAWGLCGTSHFSGALTVDAGGALTQNGGANSFASGSNAGSLTVAVANSTRDRQSGKYRLCHYRLGRRALLSAVTTRPAPAVPAIAARHRSRNARSGVDRD